MDSEYPPKTLATTLAFCLCSEPYFGIAAVGDSFACVLTSDDDCILVDYVPRDPGHASEVNSLTTQSAENTRATLIWDPGVDAVFLSTDGLESLVKIDRIRLAGGDGGPERVPSPDKVIGGMLRRYQETCDANYVITNVERHQSLKGDDIGVAVAVRFSS
ncbi:Uncharacterised protein [Mycobacteroides abscessus subsp. abscessus]|nr:Uncharacterised protein [Mycobacteroides abscessus subsp. abscessus]